MLATEPASDGQSSSLSKTLSPSLSGQGQPPLALGPATLGQLSLESAIPSSSESGQPSKEANPALLGHASLLSDTPSPSESGQPSNSRLPANNGHVSSPVSYTHLTLPTIYSV